MAVDTSEKGFETNSEGALLANGYSKRALENEVGRLFKKYALDLETLFAFLEDTQPKSIQALQKSYGEQYRQKIIERIADQLKKLGCYRARISNTRRKTIQRKTSSLHLKNHL